MGQGILPVFRDGSGDRRRSGIGQGTIGEVRDGSKDPSRGLGRVG